MGRCRHWAGHAEGARAAVEHAMAAARKLSCPYTLAVAHRARADVRARQGDLEGAREDLEHARMSGARGGAGHPRSDVTRAAAAAEAFLSGVHPVTDRTEHLG